MVLYTLHHYQFGKSPIPLINQLFVNSLLHFELCFALKWHFMIAIFLLEVEEVENGYKLVVMKMDHTTSYKKEDI